MLAAVKGYYNGNHIVINEDISLPVTAKLTRQAYLFCVTKGVSMDNHIEPGKYCSRIMMLVAE